LGNNAINETAEVHTANQTRLYCKNGLLKMFNTFYTTNKTYPFETDHSSLHIFIVVLPVKRNPSCHLPKL